MLSPLAARIYRPERPALDAARRAVSGCVDARQAWETLATRGCIPESWIDAPLRRYRVGGRAASHPETEPRVLLSEGPNALPSRVQAQPWSIEDAALIAGDIAGVLAAEALAREAAVRLAPWDSGYEGEPPQRVVWRGAAPSWDPEHRELCFQPAPLLAKEVGGLVSRALFVANGHPPALPPAAPEDALPGDRPSIVAWLLYEQAAWRAAVAMNLAVPAQRPEHPNYRAKVRVSLSGRRFAELASPFEPFLGVFRRGYALGAVTREAIALVMPWERR